MARSVFALAYLHTFGGVRCEDRCGILIACCHRLAPSWPRARPSACSWPRARPSACSLCR